MDFVKNIYLSIVLVFLGVKLYAQDDVIVSYRMFYKNDSLENKHLVKDFVLLSNLLEGKSFYLSKEKYNYDSIAVKNGFNKLLAENSFDYFFMTKKQFNNKSITKYEKILNKLYAIESETQLDWNIEKETKFIENYKAQRATLYYKGRKWVAWFTNEIPSSDGPYIFNGLPGLILEIKDEKDNFIFVCNSIKLNSSYFEPIMSLKPLLITLKDYKKILINHYNDPFAEMKYSNVKVRWLDENGNEFTPDYRELTKNEQEAIRKNNNPLELSDAIIYK